MKKGGAKGIALLVVCVCACLQFFASFSDSGRFFETSDPCFMTAGSAAMDPNSTSLENSVLPLGVVEKDSQNKNATTTLWPASSEVSQQPKHQFVVMIATARRPNNSSYIQECVDSLLEAGVEDIIVMNTDLTPNPSLTTAMLNKARVLDRPGWLPESKLDIPFPISHTALEKPKIVAADADDSKRVAWRSKESLDFVHLSQRMMNDYPATMWFLFLQDDAVLKEEFRPSFLEIMSRLVQKRPATPISKLNHRGNVALLFHRYYLQSFASYVLLRYNKLPIDWLLDVHNEEILGVTKPMIHHYFAHVGAQSSFKENTRTSRDLDPVKASRRTVPNLKQSQSQQKILISNAMKRPAGG